MNKNKQEGELQKKNKKQKQKKKTKESYRAKLSRKIKNVKVIFCCKDIWKIKIKKGKKNGRINNNTRGKQLSLVYTLFSMQQLFRKEKYSDTF